MVCIRFSASSNTFGVRERNTSSVTSRDIVAELHLALGHGGVEVVEGGQAVQEDAVAVLGGLHHVAGDLVGGELLHALGDLVLLAHGSPRYRCRERPAPEQSLVLAVLDDGAGLLATSRQYSRLQRRGRLAWAPADIVHTELGADVHQAVGHVVAGIAAENELHC